MTLNKFGTFDGKFTFTASWHPESAGGKSISLNQQFWYVSYTQVTETYNPETTSEKAYIRKTRVEQDIYMEGGRGGERFSDLVTGINLFHLSASIDPITKVFHISKTTAQRVTIHYEEQATDASDYNS